MHSPATKEKARGCPSQSLQPATFVKLKQSQKFVKGSKMFFVQAIAIEERELSVS